MSKLDPKNIPPCVHGQPHYWRLIDETNYSRTMNPDEKARAIEQDRQPEMVSVTERRWYCSHCRRIDTTYETAAEAEGSDE